jgi:hypothetical protein
MRRTVGVLGIIVVILIVGCVVAAVLNLCPPQGPWPLPPWCPDSQFTWPFSRPQATEKGAIQAGGETQSGSAPPETHVARVAVDVISDLSAIQAYYDESVTGMASFQPPSAARMGGMSAVGYAHLAAMRSRQGTGDYGVPDGFLASLDESGYIPAPAGACAAGASPVVRFSNELGEPITGDTLAEEAVSVIDFSTLTGGVEGEPGLEEIMHEAIVPGDTRLATPGGWDEVLWDELASYQAPMDSLMDYHLWTISSDLEAIIAGSVEEQLGTMGVPQVVLDAFERSAKENWFASRPPEDGSSLGSMDIVAEFAGDLTGTIEETRTFHLPEPGGKPEFGIMMGEGVLSFEHPTMGALTFDVELEWTSWDDMGRVNGGEMLMVSQDGGYEIHMVFQPDGTKEGGVYVDGVEVGKVNMDVDGNSTYLHLEDNTNYEVE